MYFWGGGNTSNTDSLINKNNLELNPNCQFLVIINRDTNCHTIVGKISEIIFLDTNSNEVVADIYYQQTENSLTQVKRIAIDVKS